MPCDYKPIQINALMKTGSTFIEYFVINIEKHSKWSTTEHPMVLLPYRGLDFSDDVYHIMHIRNPIDHLVSLYHAEGWSHPYLGDPACKEAWDAKRDAIQKMTVDEYCLKMSGKLFRQVMTIIRKCNLFNGMLVTYEDMILDYEKWAKKVMEPFDIDEEKQVKIIDSQRYHIDNAMTKQYHNGNSGPHIRYGTPGEGIAVLKNSTLRRLANQFAPIFGHLEANKLSTFDYFGQKPS